MNKVYVFWKNGAVRDKPSSEQLKELRNYLRQVYGKGNCRLTGSGEVHIYIATSNDSIVRWRFAGYLSDLIRG